MAWRRHQGFGWFGLTRVGFPASYRLIGSEGRRMKYDNLWVPQSVSGFHSTRNVGRGTRFVVGEWPAIDDVKRCA